MSFSAVRFLIARRPSTLATALVIAVLSGSAGRMQSSSDPSYGPVALQPQRGYFSQLPFEHVDMVNGNLLLTFTDLVLPGNAGMDLRFVRSFNRNPYDGKWLFGFAGVPTWLVSVNGPSPADPAAYPTLVMADGSRHQAMATDNFSTPWYASVFLTKEFWRYTKATRTLELPNGWVATYDTTSEGNAMLVAVHDAYGNQLTPAWESGSIYPKRLTSVTQVVGAHSRTVTFTYGDICPWMPLTVSYEGRTWTYDYEFAHHGPDWGGRLTAVHPPTGPIWQLDYSSGLTVTTPAGGWVNYTFVPKTFPDSTDAAAQCVVDTRTTGGRAVPGGTWHFAYVANTSIPNIVSTVTTPDNRQIVFEQRPDFNLLAGAVWNIVRQTINELQSGSWVELAHVEREYTYLTITGAVATQAPSVERLVQAGKTYTTTYEYRSEQNGDYHHPWRITATGDSTAGGLVRTTTRTFVYGFTPYLLGRTNSETVTAAGESLSNSYGYDGMGFLTSETAAGITTTFAVDGDGNRASTSDALGHQTAYHYEWGVVQYSDTALTWMSRAINSDGTVASEDRGGVTTYFSYDALGRLTEVSPPAGSPTSTTYDNSGGAWVTVSRGPSATTTTLDGFGRAIGTVNAVGVHTAAAYDTDGRKTQQSYPFTTNDLGADFFDYDGLGRVWRVRHPDGSQLLRAYSGADISVTDEIFHTTTQHYQAFGSPTDARLTSVTDPSNHTWAYQYNVAGKLTRVDGPAGPDRTWTYNSHNQLQSETEPESGTTTYTYDAAGQLSTKTDAAGQTITYTYDANNRVTHVEAPGWANSVTFTYDGRDNRTRAYNDVVDTWFTYDAANRIEARTAYMPARQFEVRYTYDGRDNVVSITYPSGQHTYYDVNEANQVYHVSDDTQTLADSVAYYPSGALKQYRFGNGQWATMTEPDARQRPTHLTSGPVDLTYQYDAVGNVTSIGDARTAGDGSHPYSSAFGYDALDRLQNIWGFGGGDFEYDALGNRTRRTVGAGWTNYTINGDTERMTSYTGSSEYGSVGYDAVGNVLQDATGSYGYSPFNQMKVTTSASGAQTQYAYDGDGMRARASGTAGDGLRYFIRGLGGQLLAEYDDPPGDGDVLREYVYLNGQLLASREGPATFGEGAPEAMNIDVPGENATVSQPFWMMGWAIDGRAASGTGVAALNGWAYPLPLGSGSPVFVGAPGLGDGRPDVGAAFGGSRFTSSGYHLLVTGLTPGWYQIHLYALSTVTWQFDQERWVDVLIANDEEHGGPYVVQIGETGDETTSLAPPSLVGLGSSDALGMTSLVASADNVARDSLDAIAPAAVEPPPPTWTTSFYHVDGIGSVRAVTDSNGTVVTRHDYYPFGEEYGGAQPGDARRFTGQERDGETGLDEFGARYYRSGMGRFTGVDPVMSGAFTHPQLWNRYAYALNNPLRMIDPNGMNAEEVNLPDFADYGDISWDSGFGDLADNEEAAATASSPNADMVTSQNGMEAIQNTEGYRSSVYDDGLGNRTIGVGHKVQPGEMFDRPITNEQGNALLRKDVQKAEAIVKRSIKVGLNQGEFDAMVSMAFNLGNLSGRGIVVKINSGQALSVGDFTKYNKGTINGSLVTVSGLTARREREYYVWSGGIVPCLR
jgi:RHS repeat-associated protein